MIYDALGFKRIREEHGIGVEGFVAAVQQYADEDPIEVLASADFYFGRQRTGFAPLEAATDLGLDATKVADAINAAVREEQADHAQELRGIRSLKGRI